MSHCGDLFRITFKYLLEIVSPIFGWCSMRTFTTPCTSSLLHCRSPPGNSSKSCGAERAGRCITPHQWPGNAQTWPSLGWLWLGTIKRLKLSQDIWQFKKKHVLCLFPSIFNVVSVILLVKLYFIFLHIFLRCVQPHHSFSMNHLQFRTRRKWFPVPASPVASIECPSSSPVEDQLKNLAQVLGLWFYYGNYGKWGNYGNYGWFDYVLDERLVETASGDVQVIHEGTWRKHLFIGNALFVAVIIESPRSFTACFWGWLWNNGSTLYLVEWYLWTDQTNIGKTIPSGKMT